MIYGYNTVFWGLFFSMFHINLGRLEVLPSFVGFLMVASGLKDIMSVGNNKYFKESLKYAYILSGILVVAFILPFLGKTGISENSILNIIWINGTIILEILFTVNLIEGSIELLKERNSEDEALRYKNKIRNFILIFTSLMILNNINTIMLNETLGVFLILGMIIVKLSMMFSIKALGRIKWKL